MQLSCDNTHVLSVTWVHVLYKNNREDGKFFDNMRLEIRKSTCSITWTINPDRVKQHVTYNWLIFFFLVPQFLNTDVISIYFIACFDFEIDLIPQPLFV